MFYFAHMEPHCFATSSLEGYFCSYLIFMFFFLCSFIAEKADTCWCWQRITLPYQLSSKSCTRRVRTLSWSLVAVSQKIRNLHRYQLNIERSLFFSSCEIARRSQRIGVSSLWKYSIHIQVCRDINRIKVCMETGRTVILLNLENLYESLYDALNQVRNSTRVICLERQL